MTAYKLTKYASSFEKVEKGGKIIYLKSATQEDLAFLAGKGGSALVEIVKKNEEKSKTSPKSKK